MVFNVTVNRILFLFNVSKSPINLFCCLNYTQMYYTRWVCKCYHLSFPTKHVILEKCSFIYLLTMLIKKQSKNTYKSICLLKQILVHFLCLLHFCWNGLQGPLLTQWLSNLGTFMSASFNNLLAALIFSQYFSALD